MTIHKKKFPPLVVAACARYVRTRKSAKKAEGVAEHKMWDCAHAACTIKEACGKAGGNYVVAAEKLCGVCQSEVVMQVKAELLRRELKIPVRNLPQDSLFAVYTMHKARVTALRVAGDDPERKKDVAVKVANVAKEIAGGKISVRGVKAAFTAEYAADNAIRNPVPVIEPVKMAREELDGEGLTALVERVAVPSGLAMPVVTITPPDKTSKGIETALADPAVRKAIADACPARGVMWVLIDLAHAEEQPVAAKETQPVQVAAGMEGKKPSKGAAKKRAA